MKINKNKKNKLKKVGIIFSIVLNVLFTLFIIIGLVGSKTSYKGANAYIGNNFYNRDYTYTDVYNSAYELDNGVNYANYGNKSFINSNFPLSYGDSCDITFNGNYRLFYNNITYTNIKSLKLQYQQLSTGDNVFYTFTLNDNTTLSGYADTTYGTYRIFTNYGTSYSVDNHKNFIYLFHNVFIGYSLNNSVDYTYDLHSKYVFKPFVDLSNLYVGVYYPVNMTLYYYTDYAGIDQPNSLDIRGFRITYDYKVYVDIVSRPEPMFQSLVGYVKFDKDKTPYMEWADSIFDISYPSYDGYYLLKYFSGLGINNFFDKNTLEIKTDNQNDYIYLKGSYYFNWINYFETAYSIYAYQHQYTISPLLNFNYQINGLAFNYTQMKLAVNFTDGSASECFIKCNDSNNSMLMYYSNRDTFEQSNYSNIYKGGAYGLNVSYPYYIVLDIDSYISLQDYNVLYRMLLPTYIDVNNVYIGDVFGGSSDIFKNLFNNMSGLLNIQIFNGISLWTFVLIPLFVMIVISIIKLIKG